MNICVIHGSNRKGNTEKTIEIVKERLNTKEEMQYEDIFLPKDMPYFCSGCFACLATGEKAGENCPHREYTKPILDSLLKADGIIFACPCYALAETGQVKAFLDHFACTYVFHRPNKEMFNKIAIVISTAAGYGTKDVVRIIKKNLLAWGIKSVVTCRFNIWSDNWDTIEKKRKNKYINYLIKKTDRFYELIQKRFNISRDLMGIVAFFIAKRLIKSYDDTNIDKKYWKSNKWI